MVRRMPMFKSFYTSLQCRRWMSMKKLVRDMINILLKFPPITATKTRQQRGEKAVEDVTLLGCWQWAHRQLRRNERRFRERHAEKLPPNKNEINICPNITDFYLLCRTTCLPISGHRQVYNCCWKHIKEEIRIMPHIMYVSSWVCCEDQLLTWEWTEICRNM
jgi:hypothetical protein